LLGKLLLRSAHSTRQGQFRIGHGNLQADLLVVEVDVHRAVGVRVTGILASRQAVEPSSNRPKPAEGCGVGRSRAVHFHVHIDFVGSLDGISEGLHLSKTCPQSSLRLFWLESHPPNQSATAAPSAIPQMGADRFTSPRRLVNAYPSSDLAPARRAPRSSSTRLRADQTRRDIIQNHDTRSRDSRRQAVRLLAEMGVGVIFCAAARAATCALLKRPEAKP